MLREKKEFEMQVAKDRALRLASIHGPFARFDDAGNEGNKSALDSAIKAGEEAAKSPEEQKAIDDSRKAEQRLEQEQGNTRRANEAVSVAQTALETANSENESLKEQLEAAEAKASLAGITDVKLDEDDYETASDLKLVKAIKNIEAKQTAKDKEIADLRKQADGYEANAKAKDVANVRTEAYNDLLTSLDTDYGADCRNEAVEKFNALVAAGTVKTNRPAHATRELEKCYKAVKTAKDKLKADSKEQNLDLDTGSGGGDAPNLSGVDIKEGSLDDVATQISKTDIGKQKVK